MEKFIIKIKIKDKVKGKYLHFKYIKPGEEYYLALSVEYAAKKDEEILSDFIEENRIDWEMLFKKLEAPGMSSISSKVPIPIRASWDDFKIIKRNCKVDRSHIKLWQLFQ